MRGNEKRTSRGGIASSSKVVAAGVSKAAICAVQRLAHALEHIVLYEELGTDTSVDAIIVAQEADHSVRKFLELD